MNNYYIKYIKYKIKYLNLKIRLEMVELLVQKK